MTNWGTAGQTSGPRCLCQRYLCALSLRLTNQMCTEQMTQNKIPPKTQPGGKSEACRDKWMNAYKGMNDFSSRVLEQLAAACCSQPKETEVHVSHAACLSCKHLQKTSAFYAIELWKPYRLQIFFFSSNSWMSRRFQRSKCIKTTFF